MKQDYYVTKRVYYGTNRVTAWPELTPEWKPEEGYTVKYADGYTSWSPKDTFEAAYQPLTAMSFGHAIAAMKDTHCVRRAGWNGKGMWVAIQTPDECSFMTQPYFFMRTADGHYVPWLASQTDMLADDWQIVQ